MFSVVSSLFFLAANPHMQPPGDSIRIHIAGPLATIDISRQIKASPATAPGTETIFDLALPEKAYLLDGSVQETGNPWFLVPVDVATANAALARTMANDAIVANKTPLDDGVDARIRIPRLQGPSLLTLRMAVPLSCKDGLFYLRIPASLDQSGTISMQLLIDDLPSGKSLELVRIGSESMNSTKGARSFRTKFEVPSQAPMEIWFSLQNGRPMGGHSALQLLSASGAARAKGAPRWHAVSICRQSEPKQGEAPKRAIFLIDRSRSLGKGVVRDEQSLVAAIANQLPPSTFVNAILFGSEATTVFPVPRMATREVINSLAAGLDPNELENGSNFVSAIEKAKSVLVQSGHGEGDAWIVIVTDGDLPTEQTAQKMHKALVGLNDSLHVLVLFVRHQDDDDVPPESRAAFASLVERYGGLMRRVPLGNAEETAKMIVSDMSSGGDLVNVRAGETILTDSIPPRSGDTYTWWSFKSPTQIRGRLRTGLVQRAIRLPRRKDIFLPGNRQRQALLGQNGNDMLAVVPQSPDERNDEVIRGQMDPQVLRNALSLAFMPRARACYVSRKVANPQDAFLRGRVRLSLLLSRGELQDAVVRSSTLNSPGIEECVRQAALAIEYPRPEHRDAPTVANLNLVFRPSTPEDASPTPSALDREIELILSPLLQSANGKDHKTDAGR